MKPLLEDLQGRLRSLDEQNLRRSLRPPRGLDLSSNDYLGLASHPGLLKGIQERLATLEDEPAASPASRLLRGNTLRHMALEERLARWKGTEATLLFTSGYQANVGLLSAVVEPEDTVISDAANHASLIDGLKLARCRKVIVPHLDLEALEQALEQASSTTETSGGRLFVVTESLYSMDGDIAPLDVYAELARRYGAELIVDDSHASGVYGKARGSGLCEHFGIETEALAIVSTFGKSLASSGAFVAGSATLIDYLVNRCRAFIFTTASPPLHLAAIEAALDLLEQEPWRRDRVLELAEDVRQRLRQGGANCLDSRGPVVPVQIGDNQRALQLASLLQAEGFDVRAIRPPTVAPGTARLRLSIHADHRPDDLQRLVGRLLEAMATHTSESNADSIAAVSGRREAS